MARYSAETRRTPAEVLERAVAFFGPGGLGLTVEEQGDCCLRLSGAGGYVWILLEPGVGNRTVLTIEAREWDDGVIRFLKGL